MSKVGVENESITITGSYNDFSKELENLLNDAEFCDVEFLVGSNEDVFLCHKCILAARCSKFKGMFQESAFVKESFILTQTSPEFFRAILQFIYANSCTVNSKNVMDILLLAIEYHLSGLIKICEKFILSSIKIETACDAMQAAVTFELDNLKRALIPYFEKNTIEIFNSGEFNELSSDALAYILQSDELLMKEYDILVAIKRWAMVNSGALNVPLFAMSQSVVSYLRLPLLTSEELKIVEKENSTTRFIPVDQI